MRCPHCKNKLIQKIGDTVKVRVRGALELGGDGVCRTQCFWCKKDVVVPLMMSPGAAEIESERFTVPLPGK